MQIERVSLIHSNLAIFYKDSQNSLKNIILIVFFLQRMNKINVMQSYKSICLRVTIMVMKHHEIQHLEEGRNFMLHIQNHNPLRGAKVRIPSKELTWL